MQSSISTRSPQFGADYSNTDVHLLKGRKQKFYSPIASIISGSAYAQEKSVTLLGTSIFACQNPDSNKLKLI